MNSPSGISVSLLVFNDEDKVLSLRRKATGRWDLPGGAVPAQTSVPAVASARLLQETGLRLKPSDWNKGFVFRQNGLMIVLWAKFKGKPKIVSRNGFSDAANWTRLHEICQPMEPYVRDVVEALSGYRWNLAPMG